MDPNNSSNPTGERSTSTRNHHNTVITTTQALGIINTNHPSPEPMSTVPPQAIIRYRECLKNHAASTGGHVLDGCGEFMPSNSDPNSPEALKCAACDCHRNFHRKESDSEAQFASLPHNPNYYNNTIRPRNHRQPMMVVFGGAESSSEDLNGVFDLKSGANANNAVANNKKRFRTKFKEGQKERMTQFAEKIGWRIQKQDENEVTRFCAEIGVKRQVFKVWMHNNKQAMKRKDNNSNNGGDDHLHCQPNVSLPIT